MMMVVLPLVTLGQQYGTCTARNGRSGECISTTKCATSKGVSDPANLCLVTIQSSVVHMAHARIARVSRAYVSQLRLVGETPIRLISVLVETIFNAAR